MADEITIDMKAVNNLNAELSRIAKEGLKLSPFFKQIGTRIRSTIDRRYKKGGPNTSGEGRVMGILISSAYNRKNISQSLKKRYAEIISEDPESSKVLRLSISEALPLMTTSASMTSMTLIPQGENSGGGVNVSPVRDWAVWHHPTSFTGIGRGVNLDRGYHFLDNRDEKSAVDIIGREIDRQMDKAAQKISSRGTGI